jgi:hypothetical protein
MRKKEKIIIELVYFLKKLMDETIIKLVGFLKRNFQDQENQKNNYLQQLNAQKNKIEQPSRYSAKGRIYDLSNKNKTKAPSNLEDMPSLEEMRAENHKRRSEAAKAAPGPTRFKPGSNKNPGRAKIGIGMPAKTEPEVDPLEAGLNVIDKLKTEKQLKGISESTEAERLRHIERLKTDPEYLKAHLQTARKNAQNKSAPPFTT